MLQKSSMSKTVNFFFTFPTKKHYLMDISKHINVAHTSVKRNLVELVKKKLIIEQIQKKGTRKFPIYKANINKNIFKKYKSIFNLTSLLECNLQTYIEEKAFPKSIVLFGSYQRGEDTEESDIDLFVECKKKEIDVKKFEKRLKRKIQLHFKEDFTSYPKELKNNIINGIVIHGFLEGYK